MGENNLEKKLTINDIAQMSGVAKSTVSRYLNGGSVKDATAQKIKKIIEENNYEPNLFARLNAKESRIIGLTVPGFNSVTTPRLVEVIVAYLKKNDYTPLIMHTENDIEEEIRCIERLKNMNVDGIMVLATGSTKEYEEAVKKLKIPILFLGQRFPGENSVINDDYNAGYAVGNYIGQRKFKEIYMLWVPEDDPAVGGERRHGVIDGLMSCEKKPKEVIETTFFYENAIENVHFSTPHIQELFEDGAYRYQWVVSLSSYVDVNKGEIPETGVLLLDMKYSVIRDVMKQINDSSDGIYYYLSSQGGEMIYHPRGTELNRGLFKENSLEATKYEDGTYEIRADGQNETVIVRSVAYTGWKMIGVVPESVQESNFKNFRYYVFATILVLLVMLLEGNQLVSRKISKPIRELDASVKTYEAGGKPDIYIGGSSEIRHLGHSVQKSYEQIEELMDEIIRQQNERRKSELDALQSQINPHFLYNTLESITWMVEAQENEGAVRMISELAKLLRVSLSRGKTIISIKDELQHSRSYMNIQLARYKERFKTEFRIEKEIENYCIVKLVIQPILENAIYYGVGNMDEDEDGRIIVSGEKKEEDILITIEDNGMGMPEEVLEKILTDNSKVPKHGSGVGVINVHSRIRLMFGEKYGLSIESEPDEGTRVTIRIPAIPYTPENAERLESQKYIQRRSADEKESG